MRSLLDFRYLAQAPELDDDDCATLLASLQAFHDSKASIITAGGRKGKKDVIDNWYIPKLELLQSVVPSIQISGAPAQWTADVTEHAHIVVIKNPARRSNNVDVDPQICRQLDRLEKCSRFELATSLQEVQNSSPDEDEEGFTAVSEDDDAHLFQSVTKLGQPKRSPTNYFAKAQELVTSRGSVPIPHHTFVVCNTAISVIRDPKINRAPIDDIATSYNIPGLRGAIGDYLQREAQRLPHQVAGQRHSTNTCYIPFSHLAVWHTVHLQQRPFHPGGDLDSTQTVNATPPSMTWHYGQHDAVLFNVDPTEEWPQSGLEGNYIIRTSSLVDNITSTGHCVGEIQLIFRPVPPYGQRSHWHDRFLAYIRRFDIVPQRGNECDPVTSMHVLRRAKRASGEYLGDVIPLSQLRAPVDLVPRFGKTANKCLSSTNCIALSEEFWLNKHWNKELFYALNRTCSTDS